LLDYVLLGSVDLLLFVRNQPFFLKFVFPS
jgi:hypothetical protein